MKDETLALKRFIVAHVTFQQVIKACEFLISENSDDSSQFYIPFFTGVCVSYMRPFKSAKGFGPLPPEYSKFSLNVTHARTHQDLNLGRNSAYAHYSPKEATELLPSHQQKIEQQRIRFQIRDGTALFFPPEVTWANSRLPEIISLCRFQNDRLNADIRDQIDRLRGGKTYENGEYIVGETFP